MDYLIEIYEKYIYNKLEIKLYKSFCSDYQNILFSIIDFVLRSNKIDALIDVCKFLD